MSTFHPLFDDTAADVRDHTECELSGSWQTAVVDGHCHKKNQNVTEGLNLAGLLHGEQEVASSNLAGQSRKCISQRITATGEIAVIPPLKMQRNIASPLPQNRNHALTLPKRPKLLSAANFPKHTSPA
jgi:hypothetical protein